MSETKSGLSVPVLLQNLARVNYNVYNLFMNTTGWSTTDLENQFSTAQIESIKYFTAPEEEPKLDKTQIAKQFKSKHLR